VSRLRAIQADDPDLDDGAAAALRALSSRTGSVSNVLATMANHPGALRGLIALVDAVYTNGLLPPDRRELVYLAASVENDCHY
jgi:alkylhydroperoxidase family enzyme